MRFMRSPLAPKKTMLHGSWIRFVSIPARNGFGLNRAAGEVGRVRVNVAVAVGLSDTGHLRLDGVTTELIAQCGDHFGAERLVLTRLEA